MIGKLKGSLDSQGEDWVLIDVHGVCYQVFCATSLLANLPETGSAVTLSIETFVREDQIKLFGFYSDLEREWFRLLMTVQGVGAKVALAILGIHNHADLATAISLKDLAQISRAPGVGKKVAERICSELRDKAPQHSDGLSTLTMMDDSQTTKAVNNNVADALSALTNLGYSRMQAGAAVAKVRQEAGGDVQADQLIRLALKELSL